MMMMMMMMIIIIIIGNLLIFAVFGQVVKSISMIQLPKVVQSCRCKIKYCEIILKYQSVIVRANICQIDCFVSPGKIRFHK